MACSFTRYWNGSQIWLFNWKRICQEEGGNVAMQTLRAPLYFLSPSKGFLPPKFLNPGMLRMLVGIFPTTQLYGLHITGQGSNLGIMGSDSPHYSLLSNSKFTVAKLLRLPFPRLLHNDVLSNWESKQIFSPISCFRQHSLPQKQEMWLRHCPGTPAWAVPAEFQVSTVHFTPQSHF